MTIEMSDNPAQKTVYITGGLGLIGKAICKKFLAQGYHCVALEMQNSQPASENTDHIQIKTFDVADFNSLRQNIDNFFTLDIGRPDIWINCAYPRTTQFPQSREGQLEQHDWRENIDIQLNSACLISSEVAAQMAKMGSGAIVNIASIYGMRAPRFNIYKNTDLGTPPAYTAIKAGLINYSRQLAAFYAEKGVRVNCVSPGGVVNRQDKIFLKNYADNVPMGRLAAAEEIAGPVVFLCSDEASYITGVNLPIDGGWTAQ